MKAADYNLAQSGPKNAIHQQFPATPEALKLVLGQYNLTPKHIHRTGRGMENETFMVDCQEGSYVLRVYRQLKKPSSEIYHELDFMMFLSESGLPVPHVIENQHGRILSEVSINGRTWQSIVMNKMPGTHPDTYSPALLEQMARVQATMHTLGRAYARHDYTHRIIQPAQNGLRRVRRVLREKLRDIIDLYLPLGTVHFDFTANNLLYGDRHITGILDFDDMTYAPLMQCLATTLVRIPPALQTRHITDLYLSAYRTVRPLGTIEYGCFVVFIAIKRLRRRVRELVSFVRGNAISVHE